jgi:SET domain-containing protein
MAFTHSESIAVKRIKGKGLGVVARRRILKGEEIERVPMLVLSAREFEEDLGETRLSNYFFAWGRDQVALALGYGSYYNHSYSPNARYDDVGPQTKVFTALRIIEPGEEITVNYNGTPKSRSAVWFEVVEAPAVPKGRASVNGRATAGAESPKVEPNR